MLRNYLVIALRTLWKQKGITAINVLGLAAGMAVCLLVGLLLWDQVTHDDFHPGADRLYRVTMKGQNAGTFAAIPAGVAPALRDGMVGVEAATRLKRTRQNVVVENQGYDAQGYYAEPSFFDVFGFKLVAGSEADALAAPYSAVITRQLARRLYSDADPVGRTFHLADVGTFTVTGVVDRDGYRSHLAFDALYAFSTTGPEERTSVDAFYTYLRLSAGYAPPDVAAGFRQVEEHHFPDESAFPGDAVPERFGLQAVSEIPLSARLWYDNAEDMLPPAAAYFLGALALLVLLAAGFNYVNLSTARSLTRAREVGVRKTAGAHRGQIMGQFVAEAVVTALLALTLAVVFLQWLVPAFNQLTVIYERGWQIEIEPGLPLYGAFLLFAALVGALAGIYPSWHLSAFQPSRVLKASAQSEPSGFAWMTPRKVLIALQFAVTLVVIVTAALLYRQAAYVSAAEETGIRMDRLVHIDLQNVAYEPFQQEVGQIPGIERIGGANSVPLSGWRHEAGLEADHLPDLVEVQYYAADYEFIEALDLPLVATEGWSEARFETGQVVLINETAASRFEFESSRDALGQSLTLQRMDTTWTVRVAGVVRDVYFSFSSGRSRPLVFHYDPSRFDVAVAQVVPGQEEAVLSALGEAWERFGSGEPVRARPYRDFIHSTTDVAPLEDAKRVLAFVAGLAMLISCLGLLGMATHRVQTRTREIGIRKALGATVASIVGLLSKDVLGLLGVAIAVGVPVAWWLNRLWLQGFAYRIEPGAWTFVLGAVFMIALALLAIAPQTIRAARTDPARTLREE